MAFIKDFKSNEFTLKMNTSNVLFNRKRKQLKYISIPYLIQSKNSDTKIVVKDKRKKGQKNDILKIFHILFRKKCYI